MEPFSVATMRARPRVARRRGSRRNDWKSRQAIHRRVRLVAGHNVGGGQMQVVVDHHQRGVAEDALQGQHVAAGAQVRHPERVAEPMRIEVPDARALSDLGDDAASASRARGRPR